MRRILASLVLLFSFACASPLTKPLALGPDGTPLYRQCDLPVKVSIDASMPPDLRAQVLAGFFHWNEVSGAELFVEDTSSDGTNGLFGTVDVAMADDGALPEGVVGVTYAYAAPDGCLALSRVEYNPEWFAEMTNEGKATIIRHEAGHVLGLDHSPYAEHLMYYAWLGYNDPRDAGLWEKLELVARYNLPNKAAPKN